jgi:peptidoglycan hydrolase-like protein with peptidoglycan-binding domain
VFGAGTRAAITNWQQENGFPQTSYLDAEQVERLAEQVAEREALEAAQRRVAARADDEFWERTGATGDIDGLRAYLQRYPDGRHAEEAADRVALLEAAVREAAEREAWERARQEGTARAFDRFLETWPEGRFAGEAREARRAALVEAEAEARAEAQREAAREREAALGLTPLTARVIEARLRALDFDPGEVDGEVDGDTRSAIRGYQGERGLAATGFLDEDTVVRLLADTLGQRLED